MNEPTRKLPDPTLDKDGCWHGQSCLSPEHFKVRGALAIPSTHVIPVVFLPGTMGSNLKATSKSRGLKPGQAAWRPPNGKIEGGVEVWKWNRRDPVARQNILDPDAVAVDDSGAVDIPLDWTINQSDTARERGWGSVLWSSYGEFLFKLQTHLNRTFERMGERRYILDHWQKIMKAKRDKWDAADMPPLTEDDLLKHIKYQYPVYAVGYNWLASNEAAAKTVQKRIEDIIDWWNSRGHQCEHVIIVTHSMGGLVGRACAKAIPDKVLGVIHGVMPAIGTPLAYRRIACGVEDMSPSNSWLENKAAGFFSDIAGRTSAESMPVMGVAPGVLELLPNHRYPGKWLLASTRANQQYEDVLQLPQGDPYAMYRDFEPWYRLLDPALCDPAKRYVREEGGIEKKITKAINQAERFHKQVIDEYYHPNTYAYYGEDAKHLSHGVVRWQIRRKREGLSEAQLKSGRLDSSTNTGGRNVWVDGFEGHWYFEPAQQEAKGDGTVSPESGAAPKGKPGVKRVFKTTGYEHQDSYQDESMVQLTKYLIVKMVAEKVKAKA